jgi:hypothetical protein
MSRRVVWMVVLTLVSALGFKTGLRGASGAGVAKLCATADCCNTCQEGQIGFNCQGCNSTVEDAKCVDPGR